MAKRDLVSVRVAVRVDRTEEESVDENGDANG